MYTQTMGCPCYNAKSGDTLHSMINTLAHWNMGQWSLILYAQNVWCFLSFSCRWTALASFRGTDSIFPFLLGYTVAIGCPWIINGGGIGQIIDAPIGFVTQSTGDKSHHSPSLQQLSAIMSEIWCSTLPINLNYNRKDKDWTSIISHNHNNSHLFGPNVP